MYGHSDVIQCHILSWEISDAHSTVAEDSDLQRCDTVWGDWLPTYLKDHNPQQVGNYEPNNTVSRSTRILIVKVLAILSLPLLYRDADKSLARPGRKLARKHIRDACDFNNIETWAVIKFFPLQGKAPKKIHAILTEILACFLPGRAKDLSAPLYLY